MQKNGPVLRVLLMLGDEQRLHELIARHDGQTHGAGMILASRLE
jgi:hypothetical protein